MWVALLAGLVASGVAGIVNQVVWQRALKIFLGGSAVTCVEGTLRHG